MCKSNSNALHSKTTESILTYQLGIDNAELILIALDALNKQLAESNLPIEVLLAKSLKFYAIRQLPKNIADEIGKLSDKLYEPYYKLRIANNLFIAEDFDGTDLRDVNIMLSGMRNNEVIHDL